MSSAGSSPSTVPVLPDAGSPPTPRLPRPRRRRPHRRRPQRWSAVLIGAGTALGLLLGALSARVEEPVLARADLIPADGAISTMEAMPVPASTASAEVVRPGDPAVVEDLLPADLYAALPPAVPGAETLAVRIQPDDRLPPLELGFQHTTDDLLLDYLVDDTGFVTFSPSLSLLTEQTTAVRVTTGDEQWEATATSTSVTSADGCRQSRIRLTGGSEADYTVEWCPDSAPGGRGLRSFSAGADGVVQFGWQRSAAAPAAPAPAPAATQDIWQPADDAASDRLTVFRSAGRAGLVVPASRYARPLGDGWLLGSSTDLAVVAPLSEWTDEAAPNEFGIAYLLHPGGAVTAATAVGEQVVAANDRGEVIGWVDGQRRWIHRGPVPVVDLRPGPAGLLLASAADGTLQGLDAATGESRWEWQSGTPTHPPAVGAEQIAVVDDGGNLTVLDLGGRVLWQLTGRRVAVAGFAGSTTVAALTDGTLLGLDPHRQLRWSRATAGVAGAIAGGEESAVVAADSGSLAVREDGSFAWTGPGGVGAAQSNGYAAVCTGDRVVVLDQAGSSIRDLVPDGLLHSPSCAVEFGRSGLVVSGLSEEGATRWLIR